MSVYFKKYINYFYLKEIVSYSYFYNVVDL